MPEFVDEHVGIHCNFDKSVIIRYLIGIYFILTITNAKLNGVTSVLLRYFDTLCDANANIQISATLFAHKLL